MAKATAQTNAMIPTVFHAQSDHLVLFGRTPATGFGRRPGTDYRSLVPLQWILSADAVFRSVPNTSVTCCGRGVIRASWHELRCSLPSPRLLFPSYCYGPGRIRLSYRLNGFFRRRARRYTWRPVVAATPCSRAVA